MELKFLILYYRALTNLAFAVKESKDHTYVRPWTNTRTIFLVESLSLAFPQSVLQISILMEDYENFPSLKGAILAAGLFILSAGITYARIRYDSSERMDRFAVGTERYIRYAVVWASKGQCSLHHTLNHSPSELYLVLC